MRTTRPSTAKPSRAIRPTVSTSIRALLGLDPLVERLDGVVVLDADRSLLDDRAGVDPVVDDEQRAAGDLAAVGQGLGRAVHAGERRRQRRMGVQRLAGVLGEERRADQLHEAGADHQVRRVRRHGRRQRGVPVGAAGIVGHPVHEGLDARSLGPAQPLDVVTVGADGDHLGAVRRVGARVEQRLEVGPRAGDEDDQAGGGHGPESRERPAGARTGGRTRSPPASRRGRRGRGRRRRAASPARRTGRRPASGPARPNRRPGR